MTEGRGLLTEREREAIEGESSDSYRYKTRTYIRRRLDKLEGDAELLAEYEPELYERLQAAVGVSAVDTAAEPDQSAPAPVDSSGSGDDVEQSRPGSPADHSVEQLVERVVDDVAAAWDDDDRLADRRAAAVAVLTHAVESGEYVGKSDAVDRFRDDHPIAGQNAATWWKQNCRAVLTEVGEYSKGPNGYRVDEAALREYLDG